MNKAFDKTLQRLTGANKLSKVEEEELARLTEEYPFFSPAQFLLAAKLRQSRKDFAFTTQLQKASLYSSNPFWLQYQLEGLAHEDSTAPTANVNQENEVKEPAPVEVKAEAPLTFEPYIFERDEAPVHHTAIIETPSHNIPEHAEDVTAPHEEIQAAAQHSVIHDEVAAVVLPHIEAVEEPGSYEKLITENAALHTQEEPKIEDPIVPLHDEVIHTSPTATEAPAWQPVREQFMNIFDENTFSIPTLERVNELHTGNFFESKKEETAQPQVADTFASTPVVENVPPAQDLHHETVIEHTTENTDTHQPSILEEPKESAFENVVTLSEDNYGEIPGQHYEPISEPDAHIESIAAPHHQSEEEHQAQPEEVQEQAEEPTDEPKEKRLSSNEFLSSQKISSILGNQLKDFHKPVEEDAKFEFAGEPSHLVDYFASQGIKIDLSKQPQDKLTVHLRSFTDWLKQMRKVEAATAQEAAMDVELENAVRSIAQSSVESREIVTETMADVFIKQGKKEKAIQLYIKLSFLDPEKSTYFANKIQQLKGI